MNIQDQNSPTFLQVLLGTFQELISSSQLINRKEMHGQAESEGKDDRKNGTGVL